MRGRKPNKPPSFENGLPPVGEPPEHLPDEGKLLWRRVVELWGRHLRETDRQALERYCHAYLLVRRAAEFLLFGKSEDGMTYNKAISLWRGASEEMRKAEEQLGLSPQARTRLLKTMGQSGLQAGKALLEFLQKQPPVGGLVKKENDNAAASKRIASSKAASTRRRRVSD